MMKFLDYLHFPFHFVINFALGLVLNFTLKDALLLGTTGILIDIDHPLYFVISHKKISFSKFIEWTLHEYAIHNPHLYIFHTLESIMLLLVLGISNKLFFLVGFGFLIHLSVDAATYLIYYKSFKPWSKYFTLTTLILPSKSEANRS